MSTFWAQICSCSVFLFFFLFSVFFWLLYLHYLCILGICRWYAVGENSLNSINYDHWYINGCSTRPNSYGCSSDLFASMACCVFACWCFSCFCPGMFFSVLEIILPFLLFPLGLPAYYAIYRACKLLVYTFRYWVYSSSMIWSLM